MSDLRLREGAVAELAPPGLDAVPELPLVPGVSGLSAGSPAPLHCGVAMEWRTPDPVAISVYSFDVDAPELPPVWCCRCGFQRDGVVRTPVALTELGR